MTAPDTYTVTDPDSIYGLRGIITDALTGRVTAVYPHFSVVIGEPLLSCCDQPVSDGPCDCITVAQQVAA